MQPSLYSLSNEDYLLLDALVADRLGVSLPEHRREMLESRLGGHLEVLHLARFRDYYQCLLGDSRDRNAELLWLAELVTNNETYFFREVRQLLALLADLSGARRAGSTARVLCAGCSSGEEPYTLAILGERSAFRPPGGRLEIDAFDVDAGRIEMASGASYGRSSLRAATPGQVRSCFDPTGHEVWTLKAAFRERVRFDWGNLLDPRSFPGGDYDAILCRNVLGSFAEEPLRLAVLHLTNALRPGGLLVLGAAESIAGLPGLTGRLETVRLDRTLAYRKGMS